MREETTRCGARYVARARVSGRRRRMTQAEAISERFGDDGSHWHDSAGVDLEDALEAVGAVCVTTPRSRGPSSERWEFDDGSAVVLTDGCWDLACGAAGCGPLCTGGECTRRPGPDGCCRRTDDD